MTANVKSPGMLDKEALDQGALEQARTGVRAVRPQVRIGPFTMVWRKRAVIAILLLLVVAVGATVLSIGTGAYQISPPDVVRALFGQGDAKQPFVVRTLRAPRTLVGLVVGAAFGLSGALVQSIARNPLASPDVLGVTAGASAAAVAVTTGGGGMFLTARSWDITTAALIGGFVTAIAVYLLAWRGGINGYRLILVGIAVSALMQAQVQLMMVRADPNELQGATAWLVGSLTGRGMDDFWPVWWALLGCGLAVIVVSRTLPALNLGDDTAVGLGVRLNLARTILLIAAIILAGLATASAGPVAFVAFVAPQLALRLVGSSTPPLLASTLMGAALLTTADWIARVIVPAANISLPVGVVTAFVGGPFLVYLLVQNNRKMSV